jgi:hypothetical protein
VGILLSYSIFVLYDIVNRNHMNFDATSYSLENSKLENNLEFKTVCLNEKGCLKYTMLDVFNGLASKLLFDMTIEGDPSYNCSAGASVGIFLWGVKFTDIKYEYLKLNQWLTYETKTECTFVVDNSLTDLIMTKYAEIMNEPGFYNNTSWNNLMTSKIYFDV